MSEAEKIIRTLSTELGSALKRTEQAGAKQLFADIDRSVLLKAAGLLQGSGLRYQVGIGYDARRTGRGFGLCHTFAHDGAGLVVVLRTCAPEADPEFDSIAPLFPTASWSEREYMDLLGLKFKNTPNTKRLVLSDDWPADIYPLRRDVPHDLMPPAADEVAFKLDDAPPGTTVVPFGPFHASLHEPAHFAVYVDGETIKGCEYRGFMTHRGIEKLAQSQLTYNDVPFVAERICGICGSVHSVSYAQTVEAAAGLRIPRRAEFIRVIMLEIERLHSHLLWLGVAGHLIGYDTIFMHAWRIREKVMWLAERVTGNRKTYGMVVVGGVRRNIDDALAADMRAAVEEVEKETMRVRKAIVGDRSIHKRAKGVGAISKEKAVLWGLVGPRARACGIDIDVRRDHPYAAYNEIDFKVALADSGDVWGTIVVRLEEIFESVKIIKQALDKMPKSNRIQVELDGPVPSGKHEVSLVEAPRGEAVHYLISGDENRPERWRVRAPTYCNLQAVPEMLLGNRLADFPIIVGSIDPCFSCTDRVAVVKMKTGSMDIVDKSVLDSLSRGAEGK